MAECDYGEMNGFQMQMSDLRPVFWKHINYREMAAFKWKENRQ